MRTKFDDRQYAGIEIELANTIAKLKPSGFAGRLSALAESIRWAQQGQI
ncbi:hypothetical protein [Rubripirellula lacrimiformis]|nr:hypothetical protein [Rubripirellula lacrimiformis]